jgi:hypothetical protein
MSAVPAYADALPGLPRGDVFADCGDASGDFVTRDTRILKPRPQTFFDKRIAVADAARIYLHANLTGSGIRDIALD